MLAHNLYYLYLCGTLIWRPRVVVMAGGDGNGGSAGAVLAAATTQQPFSVFFSALCEAARLSLLCVL
jgi:hypothetical protein